MPNTNANHRLSLTLTRLPPKVAHHFPYPVPYKGSSIQLTFCKTTKPVSFQPFPRRMVFPVAFTRYCFSYISAPGLLLSIGAARGRPGGLLNPHAIVIAHHRRLATASRTYIPPQGPKRVVTSNDTSE